MQPQRKPSLTPVESPQPDSSGRPRRRRMEIYAFLIVTAVLMPGLAVATVGTWGLAVWVYQAINGPPGPPAAPPR